MTAIYSPKAILTKQPVAVASVIRQALLVAVLLGVIVLDEKAMAGIGILVELGLGLFTWSSVVAVARVKEEQLTITEEVVADPLPAPVGGDAP